MTAKPAPTKLGAKARKLWTDITSSYDLRVDELRILEDCCREVDIVERLETEFRGAATTVKGSMGQEVASPLLMELRQHRTVVARLLNQLKLPDSDEESAAGSRSAAGRAMANARWSRGA